MKKKLIAIITAAALLLAALGAALAAPGDSTDPFVTLQYLTDTFFPKAEQEMLERAQTATAATEQAAMDRLDAMAGSYLAQAGGGLYADTYTRLTLFRGDRLDLPTGAGIQFEGGVCQLVFASGSLIDVTTGKTLASGGTLTPGHRYLAAEDTACSITAVSDAVYLSVRGRYMTALTGQTQTPFTDLLSSDWYYSYVRFAYERGLFSGVTTTTFSATTNMNRAMVATVLSRMNGLSGPVPSVGFRDVPDGQWYSDAVNWAASVGVVTGNEGAFSPNTNVTREQLFAMLYRYAAYLGMDTTTLGDLSVYPDQNKISDYALAPMAWAVGRGLLTGDQAGYLLPGGTASRAEVATILQRFCNLTY